VDKTRAWFLWGVIAAVIVAAGYGAWRWYGASPLPPGIASSNGRIEATEIDIAAKTPGRLKDIMADEGDFVTAGQVLARMDTEVLEAQLREAQAQVRRATISIDTARSQVVQRRAEKEAATAVVAQRKAELDAAQKRFERSEQLAKSGSGSIENLDTDRARYEGAKAAVSAAEAQVIDAEAAVDATTATVDRIKADIKDSTLVAPRDGRVQYRVAEPGEVLGAGGKVLNIVDLSDVYMTFFLPTGSAGRVAIGSDVHLVIDAIPQYVVPARATFVADVAQFTPKTVETAEERQKLMFRIKAKIAPDLLRKYIRQVKTGLPGTAYVRLNPEAKWPPHLETKLPQ
jgi:HlyD family secretion protein